MLNSYDISDVIDEILGGGIDPQRGSIVNLIWIRKFFRNKRRSGYVLFPMVVRLFAIAYICSLSSYSKISSFYFIDDSDFAVVAENWITVHSRTANVTYITHILNSFEFTLSNNHRYPTVLHQLERYPMTIRLRNTTLLSSYSVLSLFPSFSFLYL